MCALSFSDLCSINMPFLFPRLVSEEHANRLISFSQLLPTTLKIHRFGFECSLSGSHTGVDLGFILNCSDQHLQEIHHGFERSNYEFGGLWQNLIKLFGDWNANLELIKNEKIGWIGLAFDFNALKTWPPEPNLYFAKGSIQNPALLLEKIQYYFDLAKPSSAMISNLMRCIDALTSLQLDILYLGFMVSRAHTGIRLCITANRSDDMTALLKDISVLAKCLKSFGIMDALDSFVTVLEKIQNHLDGMILLVDIGDRIGKRIGIEFHPVHHSFVSEQKSMWENIFSSLAKLYPHMVLQEKCSALIDWIRIEKRSDEFLKMTDIIFAKKINHLKFVMEMNKVIDIKAYFTCSYI
jgi:hypothetical protein